MWEIRYGFPTPCRSHGRHRRYTEDECRLLLQVRREREGGLSMESAIANARANVRQAEHSLFAGLRLRHPGADVVVLPEPFMLAISRALEEGMLERAGGVLFGAFQRQQAWHVAEPRWRRAARSAHSAVVFADFALAAHDDGLWQVPVPRDSDLAAEWAVIHDGPTAGGCLVARESPGNARLGRRRFEAIWSLDPSVVRDAARIAATIACAASPDLADVVAPRLRSEPRARPSTLREASSFVNRVFVHLAALARDDATRNVSKQPVRSGAAPG